VLDWLEEFDPALADRLQANEGRLGHSRSQAAAWWAERKKGGGGC
jgi:hypothetical protein